MIWRFDVLFCLAFLDLLQYICLTSLLKWKPAKHNTGEIRYIHVILHGLWVCSTSITYKWPHTHTHTILGHCVLSCVAWCERHSKTSVPRSSRCPSVSVTPRTPGLYGYLTNTRCEWTSASVSLKPLWIFHTGQRQDCDWKWEDISTLLVWM